MTEEEQKPTEEEQKPTVRAWVERVAPAKARIAKFIVKFVAILGTLATIYGAATSFVPSLKPPEESAQAGAFLSNLQVVPNVTLGEFIQQPGVPGKAAEVAQTQRSEEELESPGHVVYFDLQIWGYANKSISLKRSVRNVDTGAPIEGLINQPAFPSNEVTPEHQDSTARLETWVPAPQHNMGPFKVVLEVFDDEKEVRLAQEEVTIDT